MIVSTTRAEPLPADGEAKVASFTELVATAVTNAQADVDQHDVRLQRPDARDGLGGGAGYSGDRHPVPLQQGLRRVKKRLVVIDYHAPQLHQASLPSTWPGSHHRPGRPVCGSHPPDNYRPEPPSRRAPYKRWPTPRPGRPCPMEGLLRELELDRAQRI